MRRLNITILHLLSTSEALAQMQNLMDVLQRDEKYFTYVSQKWNGNSGELTLLFKGFALAGTINVEEHLVSLRWQLPFTLYFSYGYINTVIKEKCVQLLSKKNKRLAD